jgi:hypothetical protein
MCLEKRKREAGDRIPTRKKTQKTDRMTKVDACTEARKDVPCSVFYDPIFLEIFKQPVCEDNDNSTQIEYEKKKKKAEIRKLSLKGKDPYSRIHRIITKRKTSSRLGTIYQCDELPRTNDNDNAEGEVDADISDEDLNEDDTEVDTGADIGAGVGAEDDEDDDEHEHEDDEHEHEDDEHEDEDDEHEDEDDEHEDEDEDNGNDENENEDAGTKYTNTREVETVCKKIESMKIHDTRHIVSMDTYDFACE